MLELAADELNPERKALVESWFVADRHSMLDEFEALVEAPLARTSLFSTLEHDFDVQLAYADEEVDATVAEGRVAQLLSIRPGAPLLRIRQVIYSTKTKPVIYVIGFYRSERHSLFIRRLR